MTMSELEMKLPNGFHDIAIKKMTLDYENKILTMIIVIDETGREAELFFSGMGEFRLNNKIVFNGDPSLWVTDFGLGLEKNMLMICIQTFISLFQT